MDAEKLQKLAAGRKKLKTYQKEKNKTPKKAEDEYTDTPEASASVPQIQTYFTQSPVNFTYQAPAAEFFDSVPVDENATIEDPELDQNLIFDLHNGQNENVALSSTESLRQLSSQINELIEPSYENHHNFSDLEKRNLELASLYEAEKLKCGQLLLELDGYKARNEEVENKIQNMIMEYENRVAQEIGPLQQQLQSHMQTLGILVGDKTELSASLNQSQILVKQKSSECDELQARLKTSRSRVVDLEKELNSLKEAKVKFDQLDLKYSNDFGMIKSDFESQQQDCLELKENLRILTEENIALQKSLSETSSNLSLANVKIQQLTAGELSKDDTRFEDLIQCKLSHEKQIADLNLALKNATNERDLASSQYQQYVQQLNQNLNNLAQKLEGTITENEGLQNREQELIRHVGELEKRLQNIQNEHINYTPKMEDDKPVDLVKNEFDDLSQQFENLQERFQDAVGERDELLKEAAMKKEIMGELESTVEQLKSNLTDGAQLLATIESDKVAASRAVQQNTQLKLQLEEMQEAYIKMTNDKAELVDKLTSEQYVHNELVDKMQVLEHQLHTLKDAIEIKDQQLTDMRENSNNLNKQVLSQNQLTDRLRHYEAQENSSQALINDLQEALKQIEKLKQENKLLSQSDSVNHIEECNGNGHSHHNLDEHHGHAHHHEVDHGHDHKDNDHSPQHIHEDGHNHQHEDGHIHHHEDGHTHHHEDGHTHHHEDGHEHSVDYEEKEAGFQNEIFNLKQKIDQLEIEREHLRRKMSPEDLDNSHLHDLNKELATRQLEAKFMKTMQDIANLQDEKQMLEHIVLQLQGETDTIGEYIALYQHQRGVLKQRAHEKEIQLKQLAKDRESMKIQLAQLNELVARLVAEKGISLETIKEHESLKKQTQDLCEEHAKLHKEMQDYQDPNGQEATAKKIIALLSEIKTSNLVQPSDVADSFHPCPWCSGQLITV